MKKEKSKFVRSEIKMFYWEEQNALQIQRLEIYENAKDNKLVLLGQFIFKDKDELKSIIYELDKYK